MSGLTKLTKSSILLLPAIPIAVYLYMSSGGEHFDAVRSSPREEICKQDGTRLAQLQAKPSLDEAVRFGSELRCLKLWPQLQALLDSLSHTAESTGVPSPNDTASETSAGGGPLASSSPVMEATSATSDDACKHDEDRFAELQAKPSIEKAMRFGSELRCSKLRSQLLAILDRLGHTAESAGVSDDAAPDIRIGGAEQPAVSPARDVTSTTSDDACKYDEDRLAELQAKPSINDVIRFESELRCFKLRPELLALTRDLASSSLANSGGLDASAETDATNQSPAASEATADAERRVAALERERDALAAEVGRLEHHGDSTSLGLGNTPVSPLPAIPAEQSDLEPSPASASLPEGMPARVLIRYLRNNAEARRRAESLANGLTTQGVEVADLRESATAIRTELSFSYAPDEAIALRVGRLAGIMPVRRPQSKDSLMARPGTVELSISSDSRLAVTTTFRKESNHE